MTRETKTTGSARAGVVVVNYASQALLDVNLAAVDADSVGASIFVVDNLASDHDRLAVRDLATSHGWSLVEMPSNGGFGAGANAGVAAAIDHGCDVVVLVNPDVRVEPQTLRALIEATREDSALAVCPTLFRPDGTVWFAGGAIDRHRGRTRRAEGQDHGVTDPWLTGACLALSVDLWIRTGGFDDRYFMYWEDVDLSFRIRAAGGRLRVLAATAVHDPGGTQQAGSETKSDLYYRYNCRNRLLFAASHLPRPTVRRWRRLTVAYAREVLLRGGRRQFVRRPLGPVAAALRGSVEGLVLSRRSRATDRDAD